MLAASKDEPTPMAAPQPELSLDELDELLSGLTPEIPGYRVLRRIGRGGMSYVYLAVQESLNRQVAIKLIAPDALKDEVGKLRFEKEARTIAKLVHPCIVGIHEIGRTEHGLLYYVLPYLPRGHLRQRDLRNDEDAIVQVLRSLLSALDYAHAHGVVHRDVKAENVLFDGTDRPVLADFGIAVSRFDSSRVTSRGQAVGSSGYMAPEQARGERVDGRADLYSIGVLTYQMLTGDLPFRDRDPLALALKHAQDPIPRLPSSKAHWQPFIDHAMAKCAEDRFPDARAMLAALDMVAAMPALTQTTGQHAVTLRLPSLPSLAKLLGRTDADQAAGTSRRPLVLGAVLVAAALGTLAYALWPAGTATPTPAAETHPGDAAQAPAAVVFDAVLEDPADAAGTPADVEPVAAVLPPGLHELAAARRQIARARLTRPDGDNAHASLLAAHAILPHAPETAALGNRWLEAITPHLGEALDAGRDDQARQLHERAAQLADTLGLREGAGWRGLEAALLPHLSARLQRALDAGDLAALRQAKAFATGLGIAGSALEPLWSRPIVTARPGDSLRSGQTRMQLIRLPAAAQAGLAALPHEVTRDQYAAFAAATAREPARCRVRTGVTVRARTWDRPGFTQAGDHPVVCVTLDDALAYAAWLGARDGQAYRLPSAAEWQVIAGPAPAGDACSAGRVACGGIEGTAAAASGPVGPLGLRGLHGNTREWLADCPGNDCSRRLSASAGWRDAPPQAGARLPLDITRAFDDVGFRLVRDVRPAEVESR